MKLEEMDWPKMAQSLFSWLKMIWKIKCKLIKVHTMMQMVDKFPIIQLMIWESLRARIQRWLIIKIIWMAFKLWEVKRWILLPMVSVRIQDLIHIIGWMSKVLRETILNKTLLISKWIKLWIKINIISNNLILNRGKWTMEVQVLLFKIH